VKPFGHRFVDQIIEDIVADVLDEVEATFAGWNLDRNGVLDTSTTAIAPRDPVSGVGVGVEDGGSISAVGTPHAGSQTGGPGERGVSEDVEMGL
jgi:COMPASS component BRE2